MMGVYIYICVGVEDALFSNDPFNRITLIVKTIPRLYPGSRPIKTQAFGGGLRQTMALYVGHIGPM